MIILHCLSSTSWNNNSLHISLMLEWYLFFRPTKPRTIGDIVFKRSKDAIMIHNKTLPNPGFKYLIDINVIRHIDAHNFLLNWMAIMGNIKVSVCTISFCLISTRTFYFILWKLKSFLSNGRSWGRSGRFQANELNLVLMLFIDFSWEVKH